MTLNEAIREIISKVAHSTDKDEKAWYSAILAWLIELEQVHDRKESNK